MTRQELKATEVRNEHGNFFPSYTFVEIRDEDGNVIDYDYTITKTAEEKYQEYLNPMIPPEDEMEVRLGQIEEAVGMLATQVAKNTLLQNGGMR